MSGVNKSKTSWKHIPIARKWWKSIEPNKGQSAVGLLLWLGVMFVIRIRQSRGRYKRDRKVDNYV